MTVRVARKHIALADRILKEIGCVRGNYCPVALALQDRGINARVSRARIDVMVGVMPHARLCSIPTPAPVREFVVAYDKRKAARPFEFEFELGEDAGI